MHVTKEDLQDFARFADQKVARGETCSLVDLASEWEAQQRRESEATLADIHQSHADIDAGRMVPVAEAFAEVRKQIGAG